MRRLFQVFALLFAATPGWAADPPPAIETAAQQAFIVDAHTGAVLLAKNAEVRMPPSSMSKMMTMYVVFERLKKGGLSLDDHLPVSENAWRKQGSKMFVAVNSRVRVEDLIRGVVIQSGNDACTVLAEGLAGSEDAFAELLNQKGKAIGLRNTTFRNSSGWPDPEHLTTARDLAVIALRTIQDFPEYYRYYAELDYTYNNIKQGNRNPLLYKPSIGADGVKTGHTEDAGYGLTASAVRDGRRVVMVLNGMRTMKERAAESERLVDWAFREFVNVALFRPGEVVDEAKVWLGVSGKVPLVMKDAALITLPRKARSAMKVTVRYDAPIPAPVARGTPLATLIVEAPGIETRQYPLLAGEDVPQLGLVGRLKAAVQFILWGSSG